MNLQAIYPASNHVLPKACTSCGKDVKCDSGFADLDGKPFKSYMCDACARLMLGGKAHSLTNEALSRTWKAKNTAGN